MIDTDAAPGDYAPYFERAETVGLTRAQVHTYLDHVEMHDAGFRATGGIKPRCFRDRKAHSLKIATTNAIRAKLGWEPLS